MPFGSGLSALVRLGAGLELEDGVSLETTSIGCVPNSLAGNYELETCGRHLCYTITICGTQVRVNASLMDGIAAPEFLLGTLDCEDGWRLVFNFISSLERY